MRTMVTRGRRTTRAGTLLRLLVCGLALVAWVTLAALVVEP